MRFAIYGTGGAGGYFGAQLARNGEDVTFVARGPHLKAIQAHGLCSLLTETRVRPKLLTSLPPELAKLVEDVTIDNRGRLIPRLYSKHQANKELRNLLNISAKETPRDVTQLSDAELIARTVRREKSADTCLQKRRLPPRCEIRPRRPPQNAHRLMVVLL